jgi:hypothetical protein
LKPTIHIFSKEEMVPKGLVMSAKYCIFGPLNLHLLNL